jgi:hypothetical protein
MNPQQEQEAPPIRDRGSPPVRFLHLYFPTEQPVSVGSVPNREEALGEWETTSSGAFPFGYDTTFRMTSQSVNGAGIAFGYDNDNLMTHAGALTLTRDPQKGRVTGTTLGSITDAYGYDSNGLLASYTAQFGSTLVGPTTYARTYAYGTAGRLTEVTKDGVVVSQYGYDADDNGTKPMLRTLKAGRSRGSDE